MYPHAYRQRRARPAAVVAALAALAMVATSLGVAVHPASAQDPEMVVAPQEVGIGETFLVGNLGQDCFTEVSVTVDDLGPGAGLWAPDVEPDGDGNWLVEFTVPTEDVLADTYEINATCIVTLGEPGDTFDYAPAYITVLPFSDATFPDVPTGHPFFDEIEWTVENGVVQGYGDGTFRPTWAATRQAFAAYLYRLAGSPYGPNPGCTADQFPDVPVGHPFCGEIGWMVDADLTTGYADGTFKPTREVTRQAAAAFMYRFADEPYGPAPLCTADQFVDVPIGHPFCGEIGWMVEEEITQGWPDFTFRPTWPTARQAVAAFLYRFAGDDNDNGD
jgi:hypothetical protein